MGNNKSDSQSEVMKFPCFDKGGKYVTLMDCELCRNKGNCDIYITMINEDLED